MQAFGEVLEATDKLSLDEQHTLIEILQRRLRERRRVIIAKNIQAAKKEFEQGDCESATPSEIMKDIL
jgi:uncharacterized protein YegJ (DUF2314 family)